MKKSFLARTPFKAKNGLGLKGIKKIPKSAPQRRLEGKKPKIKSISKLMKEADSLFSKNLRESNADEAGICTCYTCGFRAPIKRVQAGHLVSRWYKAVRWHKNNVRVQCWVCNIYKKGDSINFRRKLLQEIGKEAVEEMEDLAQKSFKLTREFLEAKIAELSPTNS